MRSFAIWRRAAAAVLLTGLAILLSGCVLGSATPLVPTDEAVELLPAGFTFVTYSEKDGAFARSSDQPPGGFAQVAGSRTYADPAGEMTVYFVPRADGSHLLNVVGKSAEGGGVMYGIARYRDGIMELRMIFAADPAAELAAAGLATPAGVTIAEKAVTVIDRPGLEAIIELMAKGTITTSPLIAWAGTGEPPATIVRDGDWYKAA